MKNSRNSKHSALYALTVTLLTVIAIALFLLTESNTLARATGALDALTYVFNKNISGGNGGFVTPLGIAHDTQGRIYVTDSGTSRVQVFDAFDNYLANFGTGLDFPYAIVVDASGNIYVSDYNLNKIFKFDSSYNFVTEWGSQGSGNGQFKSPTGLALDSTGTKLYVADVGNYRIQIFNTNGVFLKKFGKPGKGDGQFAGPYGVTVDLGGNIYVADTGNNRLEKFNKKYKWVKTWGGKGKSNGQYNTPRLLALDGAGRVFVSDSKNNRIQILDKNGVFLGKFGKKGSGSGQLIEPMGVSVSADGNVVHVTDRLNARVQLWYKQGYVPPPPPTTVTPTNTPTLTPTPTPTFSMFGTGADGDLTVFGSLYYMDETRSGLSASSSGNTLNVTSTTGFAAGQEVLIHQTRGSSAGQYEFAKITSVGVGQLLLAENLQNAYVQDSTSRAQVIRVLNYHNVTVQNGGTLTAHAWDGTTGGIIVFRANGSLTVQSGGAVDLSGKGFRGGTAAANSDAFQGEGTGGPSAQNYLANGNGGGGGHMGSGGGGGGNGTAGKNGAGDAGEHYGYPGEVAGTAGLTIAELGGGGGGQGDDNGPPIYSGTNGGGIAFLIAKTISLSGGVVAKGIDSTGTDIRNESGSGAGGSILLRGQTVSVGTNLVQAPGGQPPFTLTSVGGDGRIRVEYCDSGSGTTNPPASVQIITCQ